MWPFERRKKNMGSVLHKLTRREIDLIMLGYKGWRTVPDFIGPANEPMLLFRDKQEVIRMLGWYAYVLGKGKSVWLDSTNPRMIASIIMSPYSPEEVRRVIRKIEGWTYLQITAVVLIIEMLFLITEVLFLGFVVFAHISAGH